MWLCALNGTLGGRRRLRVTETGVSVASERFPCVPRVQKKVYRPLTVTPSPANLKVIDGALERLAVKYDYMYDYECIDILYIYLWN